MRCRAGLRINLKHAGGSGFSMPVFFAFNVSLLVTHVGFLHFQAADRHLAVGNKVLVVLIMESQIASSPEAREFH